VSQAQLDAATGTPGPGHPAARGRIAGAAGLVEPVIDTVATANRLHDALGRDLVYRYRLGTRPRFEYVSRSCVEMTGYTPEEHYADPELALRLVHPEDRPFAQAVLQGRAPQAPVIVRWIRRDGTPLWTEQLVQVVFDEHGQPAALEGIVRDVTSTVLAGEAVRATHAGIRALVDEAAGPGAVLDAAGRILHANALLLGLAGWRLDEVRGRAWAGLFGEPDAAPPAAADPAGAVTAAGDRAASPLPQRDGDPHLVRWSAVTLLDMRGAPVGTAVLGTDVTETEERGAWSAQLATAVGLSGESVVVTDPEARIIYVNPAFERATGYSSDEVLGRNPHILGSGHHSAAFYRAMWWILGRGRTWRGELVNRRKDGSLLIEEAAIMPVTGAGGAVTSYVAVKRDVTRQRQLRASLDDAREQHEALVAALGRLGPRASAEDTCDDLAGVLCELPGAVVGCVALLDEGQVARVVGLRSTTPLQIGRGFELPDITARIVGHAEQGPWIEPVAVTDNRPEVDDAADAGIGSILVVPLRHEGAVLGALIVGGPDAAGTDLQPQVAAATQVAAAARTLLAPHLAGRLARERARERATRILADRAFRTVFQPVVDLYSGGIVGFEATTRFDNRSGARAEFAAAAACGMGEALELATLEAAIVAAEGLPATASLFVNVSPATVVASDALPGILGAVRRPVILAVAGREVVADYAALRVAIERIGPATRVAVDHAGAGAASLSHLVQLRPDFVKLDSTLVQGIDGDFTRQALIVGLKEFARVSGRALIAEGIETELERTTLVELAVRFGQGYLLGAPAPAEAWGHVTIAGPERFAADPAAFAWTPRD
jgi:PAS domain S-box-containing protein